MSTAKIAIVGRPNVGKSALFNCFLQKSLAIVHEEEGVTRDRIVGNGELFGRPFQAIDTGGMLAKNSSFHEEVTKQAELAIQEADVIVQVVDGTVGPQALDLEVAKILRRAKKPVLLAVNKIDNEKLEENIDLFHSLGISPMIPISCTHRQRTTELLEEALKRAPLTEEEEVPTLYPRVAIVGRTNVGKSMLLNALLGKERSIVSPLPGTTRDSIDTDVSFEGKGYTIIDTAGIRKRHKERAVVEKFAFLRTKHAIERSQVALLVIDCQEGFTTEEKRILNMVEDMGKGCVIILNKWDLVHNFRMEKALKGLEIEVPLVQHCPKVIISAKAKRNLDKIFPLVDQVLSSLERKVPTRTLMKALIEWMQSYHPPMIGGKRLRVYYMVQTDTSPPKFSLFVNSPRLMDDGYRRYLINKLRETFSFEGTPITLTLRGKTEGKKRKKRSSSVDKDLSHLEQAVDNNENNPLDL